MHFFSFFFFLFLFFLFFFFFFKGDVKTPVRDLIRFMVRIRHLLTSLWSPPKRTARSRVREAQRIKWTYYCLSCVKWSDLPCPHLQIQNNLQHLRTLLPLYLAYKHIALPRGGGGDKSRNTAMCSGVGSCNNWTWKDLYYHYLVCIFHTQRCACFLLMLFVSTGSSVWEGDVHWRRSSHITWHQSHLPVTPLGYTACRVHMFTLHAIMW